MCALPAHRPSCATSPISPPADSFSGARYFERSSTLWLTSVGISAIVGVALLLSTWHDHAKLASWTTVRLFLMPFCVSSFSALVKGHGFILIFSPQKWEDAAALVVCAAFGAFVLSAKRGKPKETPQAS
jgi:hypothetical protein